MAGAGAVTQAVQTHGIRGGAKQLAAHVDYDLSKQITASWQAGRDWVDKKRP
jgi:hypothetical protein